MRTNFRFLILLFCSAHAINIADLDLDLTEEDPEEDLILDSIEKDNEENLDDIFNEDPEEDFLINDSSEEDLILDSIEKDNEENLDDIFNSKMNSQKSNEYSDIFYTVDSSLQHQTVNIESKKDLTNYSSSQINTLEQSVNKILISLENQRAMSIKNSGLFSKRPYHTMTAIEYITWIARMFPTHASMSAISLILDSALTYCLWYQWLESAKNFQIILGKNDGCESNYFQNIYQLSQYLRLNCMRLINIYCMLIAPLSMFKYFEYLKYLPLSGNIVIDGIKIICVLWIAIKNNTINKDFGELIEEKLENRAFSALMKKTLRFYTKSDNSLILCTRAVEDTAKMTREAYDKIVQLIQNFIALSANIILRWWCASAFENKSGYFDRAPYMPISISAIITFILMKVFHDSFSKKLIKEQKNYLKSVNKAAQHTVEVLNASELVSSEATQKEEWITYKNYLDEELDAKNSVNWATIKMQTILGCISLLHFVLHFGLRYQCLTDGKFEFNQLNNFIQNNEEMNKLFRDSRNDKQKAMLRGLYSIFANIGMDIYLISSIRDILKVFSDTSAFYNLKDMIGLIEDPDTDTLTQQYRQQMQIPPRDRTIIGEKRGQMSIQLDKFEYITADKEAQQLAEVLRKLGNFSRCD